MTAPRRLLALITMVVGLGLLTGCSQGDTGQNNAVDHGTMALAPNDLRAEMAAWANGGGTDLMSEIAKDSGDVAAAAGVTDVAGMGEACASLQGHVEAAQAYTGMPDTLAQSYWSTALAQAARAATDCRAFTRSLDFDLLAQSGREVQAWDTATRKCTERVNAIRLQGDHG